jgi:mono/diheme cytochrome c family protein
MRSLGLALLIAAVLLALGRVEARAQTPGPEQIQQGAELFAANCAVCHGPNGEGRVGATLNKDWPSIRPELTVREIIEQGVSGSVMPAWGQKHGGPLSEAEIDALVAYILSWQTGGAPSLAPRPSATPYPPITPVPNVTGDPNHGAVLFGENCAVCHGPNGEGRVGATLVKNWPGIRPDLNIKTTIENGISGSVMPAWSQAKGGPLAEQDINDLVSFILARSANAPGEPAPASNTGSPVSIPWLTGWGGVLILFILFVLLIAGALIVQRRTS